MVDFTRKEAIRRLIEDTDHVAGKSFAITIQILILISLVTFSIDTLPNLEQDTRDILRLVEVITVGIFTVEYILRVAVSGRRLRFVCSFDGLVDLAAILPALRPDLRWGKVKRFRKIVRTTLLLRLRGALYVACTCLLKHLAK